MNRRIARRLMLAFALAMALPAAPLPVAAADLVPVPSLAPMLEKVIPGVVSIAVRGRVAVRSNPLFDDPFFRQFFRIPDMPRYREFQSMGSGVVVDAARGYVLLPVGLRQLGEDPVYYWSVAELRVLAQAE